VPHASSARQKIILCRRRFAASAINPAKTLLGAHGADADRRYANQRAAICWASSRRARPVCRAHSRRFDLWEAGFGTSGSLGQLPVRPFVKTYPVRVQVGMAADARHEKKQNEPASSAFEAWLANRGRGSTITSPLTTFSDSATPLGELPPMHKQDPRVAQPIQGLSGL
jgi:hypothetical protein